MFRLFEPDEENPVYGRADVPGVTQRYTRTHSETRYTRTERTVAWNDICALDAKCPESFREEPSVAFSRGVPTR